MAGYHCLMPKGIILRCVPMPNLLAFFFVAFSFPNNPISSHFIALTHNGGAYEKCPGEGIHRTFIVIHLRHCQIVLAG